MSERWRWELVAKDGSAATVDELDDGPIPADFSSQADAETWIGESWRALAERGVASAVLMEGNRLRYGPMALAVHHDEPRAD